MLAFPAVSEVFPESAAVVDAVMPDEVVDTLGGDAEPGKGHDDLIRAEVVLEGLRNEFGAVTANFDA